jgi:hypothetical protein
MGLKRDYPRGKLRADDQGAVSMALAIQDGTLVIAFPYPVDWIGLGVADLERLIAGLQEKLETMRKAGA